LADSRAARGTSIVSEEFIRFAAGFESGGMKTLFEGDLLEGIG